VNDISTLVLPQVFFKVIPTGEIVGVIVVFVPDVVPILEEYYV
jgi:hypothetical protein